MIDKQNIFKGWFTCVIILPNETFLLLSAIPHLLIPHQNISYGRVSSL